MKPKLNGWNGRWLYGLMFLSAGTALAVAEPGGGKGFGGTHMGIHRDPVTGKVVISWDGPGVLKQYDWRGQGGRILGHRGRRLEVEPTESSAFYQLASSAGTVYSVNVVGYVTIRMPPGLTLMANPLWYTNNTLGFWWPSAPDGTQVLKYTAESGYEVSTYDGIEQVWSHPDLDVSIGTGFYLRNPTTNTLSIVFIGEVLQGVLTNPLPAGITTKGSLVPLQNSINAQEGAIPGQPGDELRTYVNDLQGGGDFNISHWSQEQNAWVPDIVLNVGEGFWIQKQQSQDWVWEFFVN